MNRICRGAALGTVFALVLAARAAFADDAIGGDMVVTKGMKPWEGCGECHGIDGVAPNGHFPNLAGQNANYIRKQMEDFSSGARANDHGQMGTSADEATGAKFDQIVSYFAGLPPPVPMRAPDLSPAAASRAKTLMERGDRALKIPACDNCHGVTRKHWLDSPWLEAQQPAYLVKELDDFRSGARTNDPRSSMRRMSRLLSQSDIDALGAYLGSQPRRGVSPDGIVARQEHLR